MPEPFAVDYLCAQDAAKPGHYPPTPRPRPYPDSGTPPRPSDTDVSSTGRDGPSREQLAALGARVAALHSIRPHTFGEVAVCTCGTYAVMCTYIALQHQVLGMRVPWDPANPPTPPSWRPA